MFAELNSFHFIPANMQFLDPFDMGWAYNHCPRELSYYHCRSFLLHPMATVGENFLCSKPDRLFSARFYTCA